MISPATCPDTRSQTCLRAAGASLLLLRTATTDTECNNQKTGFQQTTETYLTDKEQP